MDLITTLLILGGALIGVLGAIVTRESRTRDSDIKTATVATVTALGTFIVEGTLEAESLQTQLGWICFFTPGLVVYCGIPAFFSFRATASILSRCPCLRTAGLDETPPPLPR